jgi:hypothetical protein
MKLSWVMLAGSILTALGITGMVGIGNSFPIWLGMIGPLAAALATWTAMERAYKRQPESLTPLMVKAFLAKMIFFAAYITVVMVRGVRPIPFVVSFTIYFLALHITEAIGLHRLTARSRSQG